MIENLIWQIIVQAVHIKRGLIPAFKKYLAVKHILDVHSVKNKL